MNVGFILTNQSFWQDQDPDKLVNSALSWSMFGLYLIGLCSCGLLAMMSIFERTGLAGPHRTVLNQLVSFCIDQVLILYILNGSIAQLRQLIGPLPPFICKIDMFFKIYTSCNMASLMASISIIRFILVCIFKAMPIMDDAFLGKFIYMSVGLANFLNVSGKLYTDQHYNPIEVPIALSCKEQQSCMTFQSFQRVCLGYFEVENVMDFDSTGLQIMLLFAVNLILNCILFFKERKSPIKPFGNRFYQGTTTSFADVTVGLLTCLTTCFYLTAHYFFKQLDLANDSDLSIHFMYALMSTLATFMVINTTVFYYIVKKPQVRQFIRETLSL